jgi:hypothetical protein
MFETKSPYFYKYFFYLFLVLFFGSCVFIQIQKRLHQEQLERIKYSGEIHDGAAKIKYGMTQEEVIKAVGHPPDSISKSENEIIFDWSAFYHHGRVTDILYEKSAAGAYWVIVKFDNNNKVFSISARAD